ncbi:AfsR/SARP family transcriptional regulator [Actinacidiphila acidipaludis]|uniref:Tetratricopeptide repeat protein n=1 Tax=Actinacidiphila acidipaludis TaxID=2873382 RepID=A0ABS7QIA7_9ACTN|nr:AfsR/SARP family transcriptional regulator [Streptomyces acidipaludis]MBY8882908.1 tetratricopeptide repeat protein [Streptomyces acidipaludis]
MPDSFGQGTAAGELVFRLLGPLQITGEQGTVRVPPGRQELILAALLLEVNRVVSTDYLVDLLWNDEPPDTARTQVQICVSRLRKLFAGAGLDAAITTRPPGYVLIADSGCVDAAVFARLLAEARAAVKGGRDARAAELLRAAGELWLGDCMSGLASDTLRSKARQLDEERLTAIETRLDLELGLGRHHELVGEIQLLVHDHPLRERLRGQLMLALHRSGRQAEALEAYRVGRDLLADELGLDPGDELRRLEAAILSGDPSLHAPAAAAAPGPSSDESAGQASSPAATPASATVSALPAPAERPAPRDEVPRQLPADTADFVADDQQVALLEAVLTGDGVSNAVGLAVVVGKPGTGKSTLATHVAHRLGDRCFPDGQLYCDLRGTGGSPATSAEVLGRFLRALGIPGPVIPETLDERAEMYRTLLAARRILVVLDDAASEQQVLPLLPGSPACAVLVTSRMRLTALPGAHRVELDVLSTERALALLVRVVGAERVEREPAAAEALIRTVGGLPLALRIVSARLAARPHWTLASMVHRLANERHRLDELAHGEMTMRASLSLTHDGLAAADRRLLRLLSLADGMTLPGWLAGALLDDDRPFPSDLLEPLVDVQMLDVVGMESSGGFRYRFHEIIRVFAREQLAAHDGPQERTAALTRMLGAWLSLAEQAHRRVYGGDFTVLHGMAPRWHPPATHVDDLLADPLEWLDGEQLNLCSAVQQAAEAHMDELSWDLATTLVTLFEVRGYHEQWERTHQQALAATRAAGNERGTAALLSSLGSLYLTRSQHEESYATLCDALAGFERLDDRHGLALCRRDLALLERMRGNDEPALALYEAALAGFDSVGDVVGRAIVLTQRAHIRIRQNQGDVARAELDEALAVYRSVGYTGGEARTLRRVGQVLLHRGEDEAAVRTLTEVLELCRGTGDVIGEGHLLRDLGIALVGMGRTGEAKRFFSGALVVREQIMDQAGAALVRLDLARLLAGTGEVTHARELVRAASRTFRDRRMPHELAAADGLLATMPPGEPLPTAPDVADLPLSGVDPVPVSEVAGVLDAS